jgi:hypothetical protein
MLTLVELIYVKKKHEKLTVACKGDMLPALLVWFHHNLAGFSNSNNDRYKLVSRRLYDSVLEASGQSEASKRNIQDRLGHSSAGR